MRFAYPFHIDIELRVLRAYAKRKIIFILYFVLNMSYLSFIFNILFPLNVEKVSTPLPSLDLLNVYRQTYCYIQGTSAFGLAQRGYLYELVSSADFGIFDLFMQ